VSSVSGLSPSHRARARELTIVAAELGLRHAPELHYTQDARRWEGIDKHLKAWRHQFPNYADCSAFATWCLWHGLDHYGVRDTVNGEAGRRATPARWSEHGKLVRHAASIKRGDLALYGDPFGRTGHVAVCIGGGMVISFGSEPGPFRLPINYRQDLHQVRRYI
jgi:cell wall-associated NlpC family hydrolase